MTALDAPVILFQIVLPLVLLAWLILKPSDNMFGFVLQVLSTGLGLLAITLTSIWSLPPWWVPIVYGVLWFIGVVYQFLVRGSRFSSRFPQAAISWLLSASFAALGVYGLLLSVDALAGRIVPNAGSIDLPLPLGPGTYLVANGGAKESINAHILTLQPTTERQRAYRGQSFGVDLVKIGKLGNRASGWRPRAPNAYKIFGEPVFSPCDGIVVAATDDMPDMPVPEPDRTRLEGNHVFLDCSGYGVLMAHFQSGSILVEKGDKVSKGLPVARVGNSGQSFEPHLHIHVQTLPKEGFVLSGDPIHLFLDGVYPVRNMRFKSSRK